MSRRLRIKQRHDVLRLSLAGAQRCLPALLLASILFPPSLAQVLVPFDDAGHVYFITSSFEQQTSFLSIPDLHEAWMEMAPDSAITLVATVATPSGYATVRRSVAPDGLRSLRDRYAELDTTAANIKEQPISGADDGSRMFVQTFAGLGLSWYGITIPAVADIKQPAVVGSYLLIAGGCYFLADGYVSGRSISRSQASVFQYFATRGILHGYALSGLLMGNDLEIRIAVPLATVASLAEGFAMMSVARSAGWSEGRVNAISVHGDAGLLLGAAAGFLAGPGDKEIFVDLEENVRRYSLSVMVGGAAGLTTGMILGQRIAYAPGDASLQEAMGYLGAAAGFTIADALPNGSRHADVLGVALGLAAGHALGIVSAHALDVEYEDAETIRLLTSGGIVLGLGAMYTISPEAQRTAFLAAGTIGGSLGLMYGLGKVGDVPVRSPASVEIQPAALVYPHERIAGTGLVRNHHFATVTLRF